MIAQKKAAKKKKKKNFEWIAGLSNEKLRPQKYYFIDEWINRNFDGPLLFKRAIWVRLKRRFQERIHNARDGSGHKYRLN